MYVRPAKVEGPVSVVAIGALEVRVRRGMRLHTTSSLKDRKGSYAEGGCTMAGSVYQAPQRRFAVHGSLLDGRRDENADVLLRISGNEG
jgi:hypothetical protein